MSERTNLKGHTKTPWKLFVGKHSDLVEILDARGNPIVGWNGFDDSRRSFEEHKANAMLIVEAINEYAALKQDNTTKYGALQTCAYRLGKVKEEITGLKRYVETLPDKLKWIADNASHHSSHWLKTQLYGMANEVGHGHINIGTKDYYKVDALLKTEGQEGRDLDDDK